MNIISNGQFRELITARDMSDSEKKEFDYLDWDAEDEISSYGFFRYKGQVYDLDEFSTTSGLENFGFDVWDGYRNDSFFSGILVKFGEDGYVKVGRYYI